MTGDLEIIKEQENRVTDESVEATRRMVQMLEESQKSVLEAHGVEINKVEAGLDDTKQAEEQSSQKEKWCGLGCLMPWNRRKKVEDVEETKSESSKDGSVVASRRPSASGGTSSSGQYIQR